MSAMEQEDVKVHLEMWEKRAKKHDFRVSMAGEDSETSRHRAEELRRCIKEVKMLAGLPVEEEKPAPTAAEKAAAERAPAEADLPTE